MLCFLGCALTSDIKLEHHWWPSSEWYTQSCAFVHLGSLRDAGNLETGVVKLGFKTKVGRWWPGFCCSSSVLLIFDVFIHPWGFGLCCSLVFWTVLHQDQRKPCEISWSMHKPKIADFWKVSSFGKVPYLFWKAGLTHFGRPNRHQVYIDDRFLMIDDDRVPIWCSHYPSVHILRQEWWDRHLAFGLGFGPLNPPYWKRLSEPLHVWYIEL